MFMIMDHKLLLSVFIYADDELDLWFDLSATQCLH